MQWFIDIIKDWVLSLGYATQAWVIAQGYATMAWVTAKAYATKIWVLDRGYATEAYVNDRDFEVMTWVVSLGYITLPEVKTYLKGIIVMWSGAYADIPDGWAVCNGTNGTPDLRYKFIRGVYFEGQIGNTGGNASHNHPFTGDGHSHSHPEGEGLAAGSDKTLSTSTDPATGTTDLGSSFPPYYMLAFIMKL